MFLSLALPHWSTERYLLPSQRNQHGLPPLVLTKTFHQKSVVLRTSRQAHRDGIIPGTSLTQAKARKSELTTLPFDPAGEEHKLKQLAEKMREFTPTVALDHTYLSLLRTNTLASLLEARSACGILLDLSGTERLHKNFAHLADTIILRLQKINVTARCGIAHTIGAAWAFARFSHENITTVSQEDLRDKSSPLPVKALRLPQTLCDALHNVGITTLSQLEHLPPRTLAKRFGLALTQRIDQFFGAIPEKLSPLALPEVYTLHQIYDPPIAHQRALVQAAQELTTDLIETLSQQSLCAKRFRYTFTTSDHQLLHREFALFSGALSARSLSSLLTPHIEALKITSGIGEIEVTAQERESHFLAQNDLEPVHTITTVPSHAFLNLCSLQLGRERLYRARLCPSYTPERSYTFEQATRIRPPTKVEAPLERPTKLLSPPEEIKALSLLPYHPPRSLTWRNRHYQITHGFGPETISPEWWHDRPKRSRNDELSPYSSREYFRVQDTTGQWYWVFREQLSHRWFLHGVWI